MTKDNELRREIRAMLDGAKKRPAENANPDASPAMQEETKIETLIEDFEQTIRMVGSSARDSINDGYDEDYRSAHARLLARYQELEQEVESLRNQLYDRNASISSLKASRITPEEARAQIEGMHHLPDPRYHTWLMGRNKLRDIAGMGPQPHEVPPHMPG